MFLTESIFIPLIFISTVTASSLYVNQLIVMPFMLSKVKTLYTADCVVFQTALIAFEYCIRNQFTFEILLLFTFFRFATKGFGTQKFLFLSLLELLNQRQEYILKF